MPRKKTRAKKKKTTVKAAAKRGRKPKAAPAAAASAKKMPKTRISNLRFHGSMAEFTFKDARTLKTPLKFLDKRLPGLSRKDLRASVVDRAGKSVSWPALGLEVDVSRALHFEH